jgi:hypothetical protein
VIAELAAGAAAANQPSAAIAVPVLIVPAFVAFGFAAVQWWQVRLSAAEPASWWHLAGIACAALTWVLWPTIPGALAGTGAVSGATGGQAICHALANASETSDCLHRIAQAFDNHNFAWWSTGTVILIAALAARRSRIAAWAAIPAALAGCQLATYFLNQFVLYYHLTA